MQIGGRWRLENRLESIQVHTLPEFSVILASLHPAGGAMPTSCCFQDRIGKQWSLLCAATGPPTTSPTSAAHPKLARASTGPRLSAARTASPALFSRNNCVCSNRGSNTRVPIVDLLRHNPASPPYTARKSLGRLPRQYRENRPPLFPLPLLSVDGGTWSTPPPPCNPESFKTLPLLLSLPPRLLVQGKAADHLMRIHQISSERTSQASSSFACTVSLPELKVDGEFDQTVHGAS